MTDPYKVLNVSSDATDEQVKQAYRELARKYHPDNYAQNPLSDLAEEKMKEINDAYDTIVKMRSGGTSNNSSYSGRSAGSTGSTYGGTGIFARIRQHVATGDLARAEQMLASVPERNAEWHFLSGAIAHRKGWFDEALRNYQIAVNMDPTNMEYRQAMQMMASGGRAYRAPNGYSTNQMSTCDCCSNLLMADLCCECMGGNLIPCCGCR